MFRLFLGASGLQIYSAPSGGQGTDLSHDLIVHMFTWLKENTSVVNRGGVDGGCGERKAPRNKRVFVIGTNTGAAGTFVGFRCGPARAAKLFRDQLQPPPSRVCHSSFREECPVQLDMAPNAVSLSLW